MRPALKSGLLPVWRDQDTVQIGIDPRRAVALSGMSQAVCLIGLLDGSRDRDKVITAAADRGIPASAAERILTLLAAGGALDDFPARMLRELPPHLRTKLAAELATASLAHSECDGGARILARRRAALVRIKGERRMGRAVARILSTAGVGRIRFGQPPSPDAYSDLPAAHQPGASTSPRRQRQPTARSGRPPGRRAAATIQPDLVILVGRQPQEVSGRLVSERIPHLAVSASEAIGVVGPLVIPGTTACLRCLDFFRAASDPCWPLILAQLSGRRPDPPACDAVLTAFVAAQAAAQSLIAIDKTPASSAAANGTLELVLPGWQWRRRTWAPHPACTCAGHTACSGQ